jgi:hypothetical protein
MQYFPTDEYIVTGLPPEMYDELEAQRPQREIDLGTQLPIIVPSPTPRAWKRPILAPRNLGAASVVPYPVASQFGVSKEDETEITWVNSNWLKYKKRSKTLLPSGNQDLFS